MTATARKKLMLSHFVFNLHNSGIRLVTVICKYHTDEEKNSCATNAGPILLS